MLFEPWSLRDLTLRNRVLVSPMCQYSAVDGMPDTWHLVHLGQFAVGGAGLVVTEASAVSPEGRISPQDTGIWNDEQAAAWAPITAFLREQGAASGIQLAHAGRKASTYRPWAEQRGTVPADQGGWATVGPTDQEFPGCVAPAALDAEGVARVVSDFAAATRRSLAAGFDTVEVHAAHGYLLHQFLSPLSNTRTDEYGGDLDGRARLLREVVTAVRREWPDDKPMLVRVSGTDWVDGGLTVDEVAAVVKDLAGLGVDAVDVSSGGNVARAPIPVGPGYQVPLARRVREVSGLPTIAVGEISGAAQAEQLIIDGAADGVMLARALLRDPHWPLRAAHELGVEVPWPSQYERAAWSA